MTKGLDKKMVWSSLICTFSGLLLGGRGHHEFAIMLLLIGVTLMELVKADKVNEHKGENNNE